MTPEQAFSACNRWLEYLARQRHKSEELQRAASLARAGQSDEARRILGRVNRGPVVHDAGDLEPAVKWMMGELHRLAVENKKLRDVLEGNP